MFRLTEQKNKSCLKLTLQRLWSDAVIPQMYLAGRKLQKGKNCCSLVPSHQNPNLPKSRDPGGQERNMPPQTTGVPFHLKANCITEQGLI